MKILITGGSGFIGTVLSNLIPHADILDLDEPRVNHDVDWYQGDLCGDLSIVKNYDVIYHLAALTSVQESIMNPDEYWEVNVDGTNNLLMHMKNDQRLIFISTIAADDPKSPYGRSKRRAEKLVSRRDSKHSIIRPFNVFGFGSKSVVSSFIESALDNMPLRINGDGSQIRTFTHVEDLCQGMTGPLLPGLNFMSGFPITILELAMKIIYLCDSESIIEHAPALNDEVRNSVCHHRGDINLFEKRLKQVIDSYL